MKDIKELLTELECQRKAKKLSKAAICKELAISPTTYWRFITGKTELSVSTLLQIAKLLDLRLFLIPDKLFC